MRVPCRRRTCRRLSVAPQPEMRRRASRPISWRMQNLRLTRCLAAALRLFRRPCPFSMGCSAGALLHTTAWRRSSTPTSPPRCAGGTNEAYCTRRASAAARSRSLLWSASVPPCGRYSSKRRARAHLERELAEACIDKLGADEWLVLDGLLSRSPAVARHPRALGVIKSHGAQFLGGRGLERALTLPAGYRTSVFAVRGGHTRTEVYSWYLRLWPWEGNDLLYGLLRVEARADRETVTRASELSGWLWVERAPLATPATRWDRLLYPLHHVEEYLKARAPRFPAVRSRLPVA